MTRTSKLQQAGVAEFARIRAAAQQAHTGNWSDSKRPNSGEFGYKSIGRAAAVVLTLGLLSGCGGGATTEPTITIKPKSTETAKTDGATNGGTTPAGTNGGTPAARGTGTLTGRVIVEGSLPSLPLLVQKGANIKDAAVCAAQDVPNESLLGQDGGIANVFIYLEKTPAGASIPPVSDAPVIFDQKGCRFIPHALIARTGQTILVVSDDAVAHNTHTYPVRNSTFNTVIKVNDRDGVPLVYDKPERTPVEVKCDFHAWMRAWHLPLDHPFAAVTAEDGSFEIKDLPAGRHEFVIWHEKATPNYLDRKFVVTIKPGEPNEVTVQYAEEKFARNDRPASTKMVTVSLPLGSDN